VTLDILKSIALSSGREEIIGKIRVKYPEQISEAQKNYYEFFRDIRNISFF